MRRRSLHRPHRRTAAARVAVGLAALLALGACASPCDRIDRDLSRLNAEMIRNPKILTDGTYAEEFRELAAQSVEHSCLR